MIPNQEHVAALKTATQLLIHKVGGLEAAASVCRLATGRLSQCQLRTHPEATLPVDVVLQLEAIAGEPIVTGALARLQGLSVVRPEAVPGAELGRAVAAVTRASAGAGATYMEAIQDGRVDAGEKDALRRHLERVAADTQEAIAALDGEAPKLRAVS